MDFTENRPISELIGKTDDNSDVTLEDLRAILADEMTVEDIYARREEVARKLAFEGDVAARMADYSSMPTPSLLRLFRSRQGTWGCWADVDREAMKRTLDTREHVPTRNKREGKEHRRRAAQAHHGGRKNKTRDDKRPYVKRRG